MTLIRPRLTDHYGILLPQAELDFAIPFLDEDIPLYVDPFLLWRSPSQQDQALHTSLLNAFNYLGTLIAQGNRTKAIDDLVTASECNEVGLGSSARRKGKRISRGQAAGVVDLFTRIPQYGRAGFRHFEEIQLFVEGISADRISDISCSLLKSFLIDFTQQQCESLSIPMGLSTVQVYNNRRNSFEDEKDVRLPINPLNGSPLIFVPKRWLRFTPWINYDDYFEKHCPQDEISHAPEELTRVKVLNYNRANYGAVDAYVKSKERALGDCQNDPLFSQIPVTSAKRQLKILRRLPSGKEDAADRTYEDIMGKLLPSLLYPKLDFAQPQARTESGVSIRDLIFYNTASTPFLDDIYKTYGSRQITFELKNVATVERIHIDQLNRYLTAELGNFGVLVTRNPLRKAEMSRTVDLWSGQRKAVISLADSDIEQMIELFESKQRDPLDVVVKQYVEFRRKCP